MQLAQLLYAQDEARQPNPPHLTEERAVDVF